MPSQDMQHVLIRVTFTCCGQWFDGNCVRAWDMLLQALTVFALFAVHEHEAAIHTKSCQSAELDIEAD